MSELDKGYYNLLGSNCAETVQKALEGAGLDARRLPKWGTSLGYSMPGGIGITSTLLVEKAPIFIYYRIRRGNQGTTIKTNK